MEKWDKLERILTTIILTLGILCIITVMIVSGFCIFGDGGITQLYLVTYEDGTWEEIKAYNMKITNSVHEHYIQFFDNYKRIIKSISGYKTVEAF